MKKHNGYIYNHTTNHYLEIYLHDNLSHIAHDIEKKALNDGFKVVKMKTEKYGLIRITIHYKKGEKIADLYPLINGYDIINIQAYATINTINDLLKNAFRK